MANRLTTENSYRYNFGGSTLLQLAHARTQTTQNLTTLTPTTGVAPWATVRFTMPNALSAKGFCRRVIEDGFLSERLMAAVQIQPFHQDAT